MKRGTILALEAGKADYIHIDVMDGKFVKEDTYDRMLKNASFVRRISNIPMDVHLMVEDIQNAIEDYIPLEPNIITFHLEACKSKEEVRKYIDIIKENHIRVGISIKPDTKIDDIYEFLPYIHMCLIMTVEPGKGGQELIEHTIDKIKELKEYLQKNNIDIDVEADGGINLRNASKVKQAGTDIIVAGTAILAVKDYGVIIKELKNNNQT